MEIAGMVALITGAGSGIGRAMAMALAREGARIVVADIDPAGGAETVQLVQRAGGDAVFVLTDTTDAAQVQAVIDLARERFGGLDILCNNAGISEPPLGLFDDDGWQRTVDINFTAMLLGTRLGVRAMRAAGTGGMIVNTASMGGLLPMPGAPVYAATKAGVVNFSRSLGYLDAECGIKVAAICPSYTDTPLVRRGGDPKQVAAMSERLGGLLTAEEIAAGLVQLVHDGRAGAVMRVTKTRGVDYAREISA